MESSVKAVVVLLFCFHCILSAKSFAINEQESDALYDEQRQLFGGGNRLPAWFNRLRNSLPSVLTGRVSNAFLFLLFYICYCRARRGDTISFVLLTSRPRRLLKVLLTLPVAQKRCLIGPSPVKLNLARAKLPEWLLMRMAIPLYSIVGRSHGRAGWTVSIE